MTCPSCSFENPEGISFCGQCATALYGDCPDCGAANPPGFKFCGSCGTPLAADSATRTPSAPAPQATHDTPTSFADGRYQVQQFPG